MAGTSTQITVDPATMVALASRLRALSGALADVERVGGDGTAASGDPAVGLALSTFDDSWDANRGVLVTDLGLGADALDGIAAAFEAQDELLAQLLEQAASKPAGGSRRGDGGG